MLIHRVIPFRYLKTVYSRRFSQFSFQCSVTKEKAIPNEQVMERLGGALAGQIAPGDVILLRGNL